MEYASKGPLVTWNDIEKKFITNTNGFSEEYLRKIFRDCVKGLHYSEIYLKCLLKIQAKSS